MNTVKTTVGMASFPPRRAGMLRRVQELLPQCDKMIVYLNGYTSRPPELPQSPKLEVILAGPGTGNPDLGSHGKFAKIDECDGIYLSVDDDILYPPGYVAHMVAELNKFPMCVVGAHGAVIANPNRSIPYWAANINPRTVHKLGCACVAFYPKNINVTVADTFPGQPGTGDDEDLAVWAHNNNVPLVRISTPAGFLKADNGVWSADPMHKRPSYIAAAAIKMEGAAMWELPTLSGVEVGVPQTLAIKPPLPKSKRRAEADALREAKKARRRALVMPRPALAPAAYSRNGYPVRPQSSVRPPTQSPVSFAPYPPRANNRPVPRAFPAVRPPLPALPPHPSVGEAVIGMASYKLREAGMLKRVAELLPQCGRLCVYLNGYSERPAGLPDDPKLEVILADGGEYKDIKCHGKLWFMDSADGYYLTCDDDINYPPDYVSTMLYKVDAYKGKAIISAHGCMIACGPAGADIGRILNFKYECPSDVAVNMVGTGCMALMPRKLGVARADFMTGLDSGSDGDVSIWAKKAGVPLIKTATAAAWLTSDSIGRVGLFNDEEFRKRSRAKLTAAMPWPKPVLPFVPRVANTCYKSPLITVSMSCYNTPAFEFRRAVTSILAQTEERFKLVIVNDGGCKSCWDAISDIDDPRVVRFDLAANHGTYYAHAVTLAACDTPWWMPHDSDDASTPGRLATMLAAAEESDVVFNGVKYVDMRGEEITAPALKPWSDEAGKLGWYGHWSALWRTSWLRSVGGPRPDYRVSYDTMLIGLARLAGRITRVNDKLYTWYNRAGSLTTKSPTAAGTEYRKTVNAELTKLLSDCSRAYVTDGIGGLSAAVTAGIPAEDASGVYKDAARLRAEASSASVAAPAAAQDITALPIFTDWALHPGTAAELDARLAALHPRVIFESGSGASTLILARYAKVTGATVTSFEHSEAYAAKTEKMLADHGLAGYVNIVTTPLDSKPWYTAAPPDGIEFALIDGPPKGAGGRLAAMAALHPYLASSWELWLDDGARPEERAVAREWANRFNVHAEYLDVGKGLLRLSPAPIPLAEVYAGDVVVTMLTGGRSEYLAKTLSALRRDVTGLLETALVHVRRHGEDTATDDVLWANSDVIASVSSGAIAPIGAATSDCAAFAAASGRTYWLHLEDDWTVATAEQGWLSRARTVLRTTSVGQVRLRHFGDGYSGTHAITTAPITWSARDNFMVGAAHWTFNPALVRTADIAKVFPCSDELNAMGNAMANGLVEVAQLYPGVFRHIGNDSLRVSTKTR